MAPSRFILCSEEPAQAAFVESRSSSSMIAVFSSPLFLTAGAVEKVCLTDDVRILSDCYKSGQCIFLAKGVRDREEARKAGSFARFLHALPSSCTSLSVLRSVELVSEEELFALCSGIGSPLCTLHDLIIMGSLTVSNTDADAAQAVIRDALLKNTSLRSLYFKHGQDHDVAEGLFSLACLLPALSRSPCSIQSLTLFEPTDAASEIFRGLAQNTISSLTELRVHFNYYPQSNISSFDNYLIGTMIRSNTSLKSLKFENCRSLTGEVVHLLLASLEQNAHLTSLSLEGCAGTDWPSADFLLDCLRVNGTLSTLILSDTPLEGKNGRAIAAQLARNKRRVEELMPALKAQGSAMVQPTTMRLFLCGLPFSGKTTLSRSLVRWNGSASSSLKCLSCARTSRPRRTRGIEVSILEKGGVKVSLWDMAGQPEYYAFHDHMFPNLSYDATPSLFLYVWNPFKVDQATGKEIRDEEGQRIVKNSETFEHEFRYWLRFITSKSLKSFKFRPKVIVVITRHDQPSFRFTSIVNSFNKCQNDFQEYIQFGMDELFEMNARLPGDTDRLYRNIFHFATSILKSKPLVYEACNQVRRLLAELLVHSRPLAPLVTKEEFFFLCKKNLGIDSKEILEAIALSLNESGDIIYFQPLELVVVNTGWFCDNFMGEFIHFKSNPNQQRGFFSSQDLEDLLECSVNSTQVRYRTIFSKATRSRKIKGEDLVKLLIGLQLACRQHDGQVNSNIFIPASLCTTPRIQVDPSMYLRGDEGNIKAFVGRRLKCKDSVRTFFTPGIFSLLQVTLNNTFDTTVTLKEDVIAFCQDGVKVLVEFCKHEGQDHFIDVLIHSLLGLDNTIGWAHEELLDKMEIICANPRGIQGVQLMCEVIRPCSVEEFASMEERLCAAVSLDVLRKKLRDALEKRGTQTNCLENVFFHWDPPWNNTDLVMDLLGNVETLKIVKEYKDKFMLDVEDVSDINVAEESCASTSEPEERVFSSSTSGKERMWIRNEVREGIQEVRKDIQEVRKDIQEVHKEIAKLVDEVQKLSNAVLPEIRQKIQKLLTFSWEGEVGKLPRLFVVTKDDGMARKIVGAMVPGLQNVRLELLCEHRHRPHLVTGQSGISFATLEDGLLKQGLPYINMFLKLAGVAVKVGAHVAAGLGNSVPDFGRLLALVIDTPEFPSLPTYLDLQTPGASRVNFQASQKWLFHVLSKRRCSSTSTEIYDVFGLYRVRYRDSQSVGWLCEAHVHEGEICPT